MQIEAENATAKGASRRKKETGRSDAQKDTQSSKQCKSGKRARQHGRGRGDGRHFRQMMTTKDNTKHISLSYLRKSSFPISREHVRFPKHESLILPALIINEMK